MEADENRKGVWGMRLRRNCAFAPPHVPLVTVLSGGSVDTQPVVGTGGIASYMNKLSGYVNKPRPGSSFGGSRKMAGARLFKECMMRSTAGTFGDVAAKYLNRTVTPGEIFAKEVGHWVLRLSTKKCSRDFATLYLDGGPKAAMTTEEFKREKARAQRENRTACPAKKNELERYDVRCPCLTGDMCMTKERELEARVRRLPQASAG